MKRIIAAMAAMCCIANANAQESKDSETVQDVYPYNTFEKWRIGGYGEMVASFKDYGSNRFFGHSNGNVKENRSTIAIPRATIAGDYKFNSKWIFGLEVEFESGGVGTAYELENTENGEYETEIEKGGEVALEQMHLTRLINRAFNVRVGHMVVPVGLTNSHHEPTQFFGTVRPEGETSILPCTWHETGLEFFGTIGKGYGRFDYEAQIVSGLNANGFDRNSWAHGAKQGKFEEDNFTNPAYVLRVDYRGVPGLRIGGSIYYCDNVGGNADKTQTYDGLGKMPVRIYNLDGQYKNKYVEARANMIYGSLTNSQVLSAKNGKLSNKSGYTRLTPVAHNAVSYGGEIGLKIAGLAQSENCPDIIPFMRYEYYNPQQDVRGYYTAEERLKTSMWVMGVNWRATSDIVVKADYTTRKIGGGKYNSENEFAIGIAWTGWFFSN
jgi:hypothetical protein